MSSNSNPTKIEEIEAHGKAAETTVAQTEPVSGASTSSDPQSEPTKTEDIFAEDEELEPPPPPPGGTPRGKITNTISGKPGGGSKPRPAPK